MSTADYTKHAALSQMIPHSALMEDYVPLDPSFKGLPWLALEGKLLKVPRIAPTDPIIDVALPVQSGQDLNDPTTFRKDFVWAEHEFELKTIATDRVLDDRIVRELSDPNLAEQYVIQAGTEAVLQRFAQKFLYGVEAAPDKEEFNGINALCANTVVSSGTIEKDMDSLMYFIRAGDGIPTAFLAHPSAINAYRYHCYKAGFNPESREHPVFGLRTHHAGIPVLPNHHIVVEDEGSGVYKTTVFCVQFGIGTGVAGIFPARNGEMGVRVDKRPDDDEDVWYYKVKLECGLALYRESAISKCTQIDVSDFYPVT